MNADRFSRFGEREKEKDQVSERRVEDGDRRF